MFGKLGNLVIKFKVWIISAWVAAALLLFFLAPSLSQVGTMSESTFLPRDSESLRARELIEEYFPSTVSASTASLVFYNPQQLNDNDLAYAQEVTQWLTSGSTPFKVASVTSIFTNPDLESRLMSPDKTTMLLNVGLDKAAFESDAWDTAQVIRDYLHTAPEGLEVYVSGQVGVYSDLFESLNQSITTTTLVTIILVIVLLIINFRSPVAALVPLLTIGVAFLVARGIMGFIGSAGVSIWSQIEIFLIVLIFGIGTDYCLFLISRFREELAHQGDRQAALKSAVSKIGVVITASALAVVVGLAGMAVARYQMIQTMGPLLGVAILITLLAALTLAPALASLFGHRLFWPLHDKLSQNSAARRPGLWDRIVGFTTRKPAITAAVVVIVLLLPYLALPGLNRSFDQMAEIPSSSESVAGFKILQEHYDIGEMDPSNLILVAPEGQNLTSPEALQALSQITADLRQVNGVVKVQSILQPDGTGSTLAELTVSGQLTAIGDGITSSFSGSDADPSLIFSDQVNAGFLQVSSYLDELNQNFPWVRDDASFQSLNTSLTEMQQTLAQVKAGALVENQIQSINAQIQQMGLALAVPGAALPSDTANSLNLFKSYLDELSAAYPDVKTTAGFQNVYTILNNLQSQMALMQSLTPEQQQMLSSALPQYLQQLSSGLAELVQYFSGSQSVLFSNALASASQESSPLTALEAEFADFNTGLQTLSAAFQANGNPPFLSSVLLSASTQSQELLNLFYSQDRQAARMYIVLDAYPQSDAALQSIAAARQTVQSSTAGTVLNGSEVVIGGTTAELRDVQQVLDSDFNRILIVVLAAIFIVLAFLLRSLVAPLYLLLTVLLSYGTTLGIVTWIFQGLLGQEGISFLIPIIVFVLLVALGSDYNIFLMSRVREESVGRTTREGARLAAIATGGVITACGIILAGTFGALVITPIRTLMQIGAAVAIGVLIDTFLVRALLVPAVASLVGRWNWWPFKRS